MAALYAAERGSSDPVRTDRRCNPNRFRDTYDVTVLSKKPVVTHIRSFALPPSSRHRETKVAFTRTRLRAEVQYSGSIEVGASGAFKILAKASIEASMQLKAAGSHTKVTKTRVTDWVSNRTGKNVQTVFFRGNMSASGRFLYTYCSNYYTPTGDVGYYVYRRTGTWRSFDLFSSGGARCGAGGDVNAVTRAALAAGC